MSRARRCPAGPLVGFLLFIAMLTTPSLAHDWYPPECCSGKDCRPVVCNLTEREVTSPRGNRVTMAVYTAPDGVEYFILKSQTRPSPDARCHVCPWPGTKTLRCLFIPVPATFLNRDARPRTDAPG